MKTVVRQLREIFGDRLKEREPLARYTTFKIGGPADFFFKAREIDELVKAITAARKLNLPVFILGGGSNILIGDRGIRGLVIKNSTSRIVIKGAKGTVRRGEASGQVFVEADSGVIMNQLVRFTLEERLAGLEMHLGLPGTVGGAMYMNSKWTQPQAYVGDAVHQATILTPKGEVKLVPRSYFRFGYDQSIIQKSQDIVLRVVFALTPRPKKELWEIAERAVAYRRASQPQGVFSPGCTFRNISRAQAIAVSTPNHTTSAGFLLDRAGLKGLTVGQAQISPIHANFIINKGEATTGDVLKLIEIARARVKQKYGVELKEEIVKIGDF